MLRKLGLASIPGLHVEQNKPTHAPREKGGKKDDKHEKH